jgi:hypothetical protein
MAADRHLVDGDVGPEAGEHARLTTAWSWATALDRPARRRPMTAMLKRSLGLVGAQAELHELLDGVAVLLDERLEVPLHQVPGKRSMPAGPACGW